MVSKQWSSNGATTFFLHGGDHLRARHGRFIAFIMWTITCGTCNRMETHSNILSRICGSNFKGPTIPLYAWYFQSTQLAPQAFTIIQRKPGENPWRKMGVTAAITDAGAGGFVHCVERKHRFLRGYCPCHQVHL